MEDVSSRKKSHGRPALSLIEKQRRLVARLHENADELLMALEDDAGHFEFPPDEPEYHLLLSTLQQRISFAREVAKHEQAGEKNEAKAIRQKLNLFRPLGLTEETWNALPDGQKRHAPGKPKMPKELELARIEIACILELGKLREMEAEFGEAPADIESLRAQHGNTQIGRPGKDILGALDKEMYTAFYKRRDLPPPANQESVSGSGMGRPKKSYKERYAYYTRIIDHCRSAIAEGESKLNLVHLQLRYLKRLRDRATRMRLQIKTALGPTLIALKNDLAVIEEQISTEARLLNDFQENFITLSNSQLDLRRNSVAKKIQAFDALELTSHDK